MGVSFALPTFSVAPTAPRHLDRQEQSVHHVEHVREASRLPAVAMDHQRSPGQRGVSETGEHHSLVRLLARTDCVEQTDDCDRQVALRGQCGRPDLSHCLGRGVGGPRIGR